MAMCMFCLVDGYYMILRCMVVPCFTLRAKSMVGTRQNVFSSERLNRWERLYVEFWLVVKRLW